MTHHNLINKTLYPAFHRYHASPAINIFSAVPIREGDTVIINGSVFRLGTSKYLKGLPNNTEQEGVHYYEFKLTLKTK